MARKKSLPELVSRDEASATLRELLTRQVELEKMTGQLDLARAQATAQFETPMDAVKTRIADLTSQLQTWFVVHGKPEDGKKSITLAFGTIGTKLDPPSLKILNRSWTWESIVAKVKSKYPGKYFHAPKPALDKDLIRVSLTEGQLRECGLRVFQEDEFYVELDRSSLGDA